MIALHGVWNEWGAEPGELALIALPAAWYALGVRALWRSAGSGRGVSRMRCAAFGGAVIALLVALASPLDAAAEDLFSMHMAQHLILILVAAPLWAFGAPVLPMLWALPSGMRRRVARWWRREHGLRAACDLVMSPGAVFALHAAALWFWHFPGPYDAALEHPVVHALEHLSFFGTAVLFWWVVAQPLGRRRASHAAGILLIAGTLMQSGALGAVLMFARAPWYPGHGAGAAKWGTTLLADQQLAGLLMWIPASFVYVTAAALVFLSWMREDEGRMRRVGQLAASASTVAALLFAAILIAGCSDASEESSDRHVEGGDADRGRASIVAYGCGSCHQIPGVSGAHGMVGPPLDHWSRRRIIAGEVPNDPERLITWLTVPQSIEPGTAMPNMGVTDGEARDMAAYLYTLR